MNTPPMTLLRNGLIVIICMLMIPFTAVATAAAKQRFEDGPNRVFSGGPLVSGEMHTGPDPDWSFVNDIPTIEMQLLRPTTSRRIWVASADGRLFIWSGYMDTVVGRMWKRWPIQAEADGRAVLRIDGRRFERQLQRMSGTDIPAELERIIADKYPSRTTAAAVQSGQVWMFEALPRTP